MPPETIISRKDILVAYIFTQRVLFVPSHAVPLSTGVQPIPHRRQ